MSVIEYPIENVSKNEYVKQTWEDGVSPVNAERMNHIEEGLSNAAVYIVDVAFDESTGALSVAPGTFSKVSEAVLGGKMVFARTVQGGMCMFIPFITLNNEIKAVFGVYQYQINGFMTLAIDSEDNASTATN